MASVFGHAVVSIALTSCFSIDKKQATQVVILGVICSVLPDVDVAAFRFGIPYSHPFGHRGFTHSIFFALVWSALFRWLFFHRIPRGSGLGWRIWSALFMSTLSHGVLDAMTTGGRGVAFFGPFENSRHFLPWRMIQVSPMSAARFFSEWGVAVLKSEAIWIGIPSVIVLIINGLRSRWRNQSAYGEK